MPYARTRKRRAPVRRTRRVRRTRTAGSTGVLGFNAFNLDDSNDHIASPLESARRSGMQQIYDRQWAIAEKKNLDIRVKENDDYNRAKQARKDYLNSWDKWTEDNVPDIIGTSVEVILSATGIPELIAKAGGQIVRVTGHGLAELITGHDHNVDKRILDTATDIGLSSLSHEAFPKELKYGVGIGRAFYTNKPGMGAHYTTKLRKQLTPVGIRRIPNERPVFYADEDSENTKRIMDILDYDSYDDDDVYYPIRTHNVNNPDITRKIRRPRPPVVVRPTVVAGPISPVRSPYNSPLRSPLSTPLKTLVRKTIRLPTPVKENRFGRGIGRKPPSLRQLNDDDWLLALVDAAENDEI